MSSVTAHDAKQRQKQSEEVAQHLLKLAREVRDSIYTLAMEHLPTRFSFEYGMQLNALTLYPQTLLLLCFTNRQTYNEGVHTWLRRTSFVLSDDTERSQEPLLRFIHRFSAGYKSIRMLTFKNAIQFDYGHHMPYSVYKNIVGIYWNCPGLRKLTLETKTRFVLNQIVIAGGYSRYETLSNDELYAAWDFQPLSLLPSLRYFELRIDGDPYHFDESRGGVDRETLIDSYRTMFVEKFRKDGRSTEIVVSVHGDDRDI
jgi:hypothetical protein